MTYLVWIFFNTKGKHENVSEQVADRLHYIETKQACDEFTRHLETEVTRARQNKEWMVEYMKTMLHDMDARDEGRLKGRLEGIAEGELRGHAKAIIELVKKKMIAGKGIERIAEEIEESTDSVQAIYDAVSECGLESDVNTIFEMMQKKEK